MKKIMNHHEYTHFPQIFFNSFILYDQLRNMNIVLELPENIHLLSGE